jgi:hypothetical protein
MNAALLQTSALAAGRSPAALWAGRILTGVVVLFLAFDTVIKLVSARVAVDATLPLGFTAQQVPLIGGIELVCLALYLIPRTAPLGAVLLTGYLGGAIATHLRLGNPLFSHVLFPVYIGAMVWGGLYLRDARVGIALGAGAR